MARFGAIPAARNGKVRVRIRDMGDSPIVFALDPGVTTGWSVMQVHPEALVNPQMKILDSIEFWSHGQISGRDRPGLISTLEIFDGEGRIEYTDLGAEAVHAECMAAEEALDIFDRFPGAVSVLEDFIPQRLDKQRDFLSPVRITARYDMGLYQRGYQSFRQMPSEAKETATSERLREWGLFIEDGMQHARDADRHAIMWLRRCSQKRNLRAAAWPHLYGEYEVRDDVKSAGTNQTYYQTVRGPYWLPPKVSWAEYQAMEAANS